MTDQNKNTNPERVVGISGLKMDNSSLTDTNISSSNPDSKKVGIFDTEMKDSNISKLTISDNPQLSEQAQNELKEYGVEEVEINELNEIIKQTSKDKPTMTGKVLKWLGSVSASVAAKGLYDNLPMLTDFVHKIIQ